METILDAVQAVGTLAVLAAVLIRRKSDREARSRIGTEYARIAVSHAKRMGGDSKAQLSTALAAFRLADEAADGKRDFTDAQARILIEAAFHE